MKHIITIFLLVLPLTSLAANLSATATTTVTANIVKWTEDPCDFPQHQDKCRKDEEESGPERTVLPSTEVVDYE